MMRITFHEKNVRRAEKSAACGQESIYAGCDGSGKIRYLLNDGSLYENRSCVLKDGVFQFDGYSTWFEEAGENRRHGCQYLRTSRIIHQRKGGMDASPLFMV